MSLPVIVIATPHSRNDRLEDQLRGRLPGFRIVRIRGRDELSATALEALAPQFVFFPHWPWLVPEHIHESFTCVIFHMTDLPYGRGGSPLQNLIVRGHQQTVVSALRCEAEVDAGPIYLKRPLSLLGTAEEILQRASDIIESMIVEIAECQPVPQPQQGQVVSFKRRRPQDGDLAGLTELQQVFDFIRMLDADGYPAAFLTTEHLRVEFCDARFEPESVEARVRITKRQL